jgi:hypothetical protein
MLRLIQPELAEEMHLLGAGKVEPEVEFAEICRRLSCRSDRMDTARLATLRNHPERDRRSALMHEASMHESMSLVNVRRNWIR